MFNDFLSWNQKNFKCQTLQKYLASTTVHFMTSPGPKGCRNQVLPRPDWLLDGWVGFTARLVFTSPFLSSLVGITTTGMRVHCSSVPSEDITSVYPSSQLHVLVCREQVFLHYVAESSDCYKVWQHRWLELEIALSASLEGHTMYVCMGSSQSKQCFIHRNTDKGTEFVLKY